LDKIYYCTVRLIETKLQHEPWLTESSEHIGSPQALELKGTPQKQSVENHTIKIITSNEI